MDSNAKIRNYEQLFVT